MILPVWSTATPARSGSATAVETHPAGNVHHYSCLLFAGVVYLAKENPHTTVIQVWKHSTLSSALVTVNNKRLLRNDCIKGTVLIFFFFFNLSSSLILEKFLHKNSLNDLVNERNQTLLFVLAVCVCVCFNPTASLFEITLNPIVNVCVLLLSVCI